MKGIEMKKALLAVAVIVVGVMFACAAQAQSLMIGQLQGIRAPICKNKADMVAVAKMDSKEGIPAAKALLMATPDCAFGEFEAVVRSIVIALPTARGATVRVLAVEVTMADGSVATFYVLTDAEFDDLKAI